MPGSWQERNISSPLPNSIRQAAEKAEGNTGSADSVHVIEEGDSFIVEQPMELLLENGTQQTLGRVLPGDIPCGYHVLRRMDSGAVSRLIVAPPRCFLPEEFRAWGWSVQLYSARSRRSWGIGDLRDLKALADWTARHGGDVILVNPLKADWPVGPQQPSPYSPITRRFGNLLYVQPESIEGASQADLDLNRLAGAGHALNEERRIDRGAVLQLKIQALRHLWDGGRWLHDSRREQAFDRYRQEQGPPLRQFARFCVMAEQWGTDWRQWPGDFRRPQIPFADDFDQAHEGRIGFYEWTQWQFDQQLNAASRTVRIFHDVPVGFTPDGFDAWVWQDALASDMTIGAPPDAFSADGQSWGLPPFVPERLRALAYEPFIQTIRASCRHAGGIRLDHVMGLFRQWWIPSGQPAREGGYVHYPAEDLLAIVALESQRAGAIVIGEDLGTVEEEVRAHLSRRHVLSYKVMWFEADPPTCYPRLSVASATTHDLPTLAGVWTGGDARVQRERGGSPDMAQLDDMRQRLQRVGGVDDQADVESVVERVYRQLAASSSAIVLASMEDGTGGEERPNYPDAMTSELNWSVGQHLLLEDWCHAPSTKKIVAQMDDRRGSV